MAGATVSATWGAPSVTSGGDGAFQLTAQAAPSGTPYDLNVSAAGFVNRRVYVTWHQGPRTGVTFDLIRNSAPFSIDFYKDLARGSFDQPGAPWQLLRWTDAPKFYLKTVDENGKAIEPEVITLVLDAIRRAVPAYSGDRFQAEIETGTEKRGDIAGWINVLIQRDPEDGTACGWAYVGRSPGEITLIHDYAPCACGSRKVSAAVVVHEVGHAMGFFHVRDRSHALYPFAPGACPAGEVSPAERYHAGVAYSRPRGNTDPDNDPTSGRLSSTEIAGPGIRIKN